MRAHPVLACVKKHSKLVLFIDGASRGNPGPASAGVVIQDAKGATIRTLAKRIGTATNNTAEYAALLFGLQEALALGAAELDVRTDSELLARQYSGQYKIKDEQLKLFAVLIRQLKEHFKSVTVSHVPREQNKLADAEANRALDADLF